MPPITPEPSSIIQNWCRWMPSAETSMPPHQHSADTTPALRGPARSSQPPQIAAAQPRKTKNSVYIQPRVEMVQLQSVAVNSAKPAASEPMKPVPLAQVAAPDSTLLSGSQNTEKP